LNFDLRPNAEAQNRRNEVGWRPFSRHVLRFCGSVLGVEARTAYNRNSKFKKSKFAQTGG
jgi:hypothetical protein